MKVKTPASFLLIRLSSLGDILLTTPALRALRATYPQARIDFLTSRRFLELLQGNPHLSELILFDDHGDFDQLQTLTQPLQKRYEVVIDLHTSLRSAYVRRRLGAKRVLAYTKHRLARWLLVKFKRNFYHKAFSVPRAYLEAMRTLGVQGDGRGLEWLGAAAQREAFLHLLESVEAPHPQPIALCPGASYPTKRWPAERWIELATMLLEQDHSLWIFGDENDQPLGEHLQSIDSEKITSFCGKLGLAQAGAGLSYCRLAVTHDAGPAHMAAAVGTPVVDIYGSTVPEFGFAPYGVPHRIVAVKLPCRPCSHLGFEQCPLEHFKCMMEISAERVVQEVEELILPNAPPSPRHE